MKLPLCMALVFAAAGLPAAGLRVLQPSPTSGSAAAVVVPEVPLAHTAQVFPVSDGRLVGAGDVSRQAKQVLLNLSAALREARSGLDRTVKLNLYVTSAAHVEPVQKVLASYFDGLSLPAVAYVETLLPVPGAWVAMDAVAMSETSAPAGAVNYFRAVELGGGRLVAHAAVLPPGRRVFVSGQAEKGATLAECTTRTLQGLEDTLAFLGINRGQIVQLKCFFNPLAGFGAVERAVGEFFKSGTVPPLVFVEWQSPTPIEIELIAADGSAPEPSAGQIEFLTPPGMKPSPVYSKVTRVNRGRLFYLSGLYPPPHRDAPHQVREVFGELRKLCELAGGDLKHLAKATYYVSKEDVSKALNDVRPDYFDPKRPPAASKAPVRGVAMPDRAITMDMIGVVP